MPAPDAGAERRGPARRLVRVLFVTRGNACLGPMAEAFANTLGGDILSATSAGVNPAGRVSALARMVMAEKRIAVPAARPRGMGELSVADFDLIVNLTGEAVDFSDVPVLRYSLQEPEGRSETEYRRLRDRVEALVAHLSSQLREVCRGYRIGAAA